jgi:Family of unknown function (DUF6533)
VQAVGEIDVSDGRREIEINLEAYPPSARIAPDGRQSLILLAYIGHALPHPLTASSPPHSTPFLSTTSAFSSLEVAATMVTATFDTVRTLVTVFSVLIYTEYLINLAQEIRHIWKRRFNLVSGLYLFAR